MRWIRRCRRRDRDSAGCDDPSLLKDSIDKAVAAGIPVITIDSMLLPVKRHSSWHEITIRRDSPAGNVWLRNSGQGQCGRILDARQRICRIAARL